MLSLYFIIFFTKSLHYNCCFFELIQQYITYKFKFVPTSTPVYSIYNFQTLTIIPSPFICLRFVYHTRQLCLFVKMSNHFMSRKL